MSEAARQEWKAQLAARAGAYHRVERVGAHPTEDPVALVKDAKDAVSISANPELRTIAEKLIVFFGDVPPDEIPVMVMEDPSTVTQFVAWARAALAKAEGKPR